MTDSNVKKLVAESKSFIEVYINSENNPLKDIKFNSLKDVINSITEFKDLIFRVVCIIELASSAVEDVRSEDKLQAAVEVLDEMIHLPWYLEAVDGPIIKIVLSIIVDFLNGKGTDNKFNAMRSKQILDNL
jgi:hypothetical protein